LAVIRLEQRQQIDPEHAAVATYKPEREILIVDADAAEKLNRRTWAAIR
jgi:hypothetical protein